MRASKNNTKNAAIQLASLMQGHMDKAGLNKAQREENLVSLEKVRAKIASSREKSSGLSQAARHSGSVSA
jgi:hypothetical protein